MASLLKKSRLCYYPNSGISVKANILKTTRVTRIIQIILKDFLFRPKNILLFYPYYNKESMAGNSFKRILSSKIFLFILLLAFIWLSLILVKITYRKYELDKQVSDLKAEVEKIDKSTQEFSQLLEYFKSQGFLEKEAKEKLNLQKEGENVMMVPEAAINQEINFQQNGTAVSSDKEIKKAENNLIKWWKIFFGE